MAVRVVLAEDDYLIREGVRLLLDGEPSLEVVAGYPDARSVLENLGRDAPDVVLSDIRMPPNWEDEGLALARELRELAPEVAFVALSQVSSPEYAAELFANGTERRAYVLKDRVADRATLIRIIQEVSAGGSYVDPEVIDALVAVRTTAPSPLDELTGREREVLALLAEGLSNAGIAARLHLTKRSVEGHINSIFLKLGLPEERHVSRRVAAALLFLSDTETRKAH